MGLSGAAPPYRLGKLWTIAWIVYAPLLLLFVAMPGQIVSRLDDFPSTPMVREMQQAAMAVAKASDILGIEPFYKNLHARFLAASTKQARWRLQWWRWHL